MSIQAIQTAAPTGLASVNPEVIYILTTDAYATVTATGYLTQQAAAGYTFNNQQMALVYTTDDGPVWLKVVITFSGASILNTVVSLVAPTVPGSVTLPTITNHLIVSTNTVGTLANLSGTAINNGILQSGLAAGGFVGGFVAYPTTTASGFLELLPVVNSSGNFNTIISNASAIGQSQTVSIPDGGSATSNFIISKSAGTQHITTGALQVDAGAISSGLSTGGFVGLVRAYPTTTASGFIAIQAAVNGSGNFGTTISNATTQAQAQVMTVPDVAASTGQFVVKTAAFVSGNFPQNSGTAGLVIDSGIAVSNLQQKTQVKAVLTGNIGGAGAGPLTITVAGMTAASVVVATVSSSSNPCYVLTAVPGSGSFALTVSADPGASLIVNYIAYIAAQ